MTTAHTGPMLADLPCDGCGYDLRAQPQDGICPECGASVEASRRAAAIPRRPAWRDSDPRWRRRVLAGAWVLVLLPLMDLLHVTGWAASVPAPNLFGSRGARTLDESLFAYKSVYEPLVFCVGVVLLFARERGRQRRPLDWTRRWGVLCSYLVLLLAATHVLFISGLVAIGIAAIFISMPLENQPRVTQWFVDAGAAYLRFGPHPNEASGVAQVGLASVVVLLACVPLFDALRSSGSRRVAVVLLAPLAFFALLHAALALWYFAGGTGAASAGLGRYELFFWPELLVRRAAGLGAGPTGPGPLPGAAFVEAVKWFAVLAIAVRLSVARLPAWGERDKARAARRDAGGRPADWGPL